MELCTGQFSIVDHDRIIVMPVGWDEPSQENVGPCGHWETFPIEPCLGTVLNCQTIMGTKCYYQMYGCGVVGLRGRRAHAFNLLVSPAKEVWSQSLVSLKKHCLDEELE